MNQSLRSPLCEALALALSGLPVFPCNSTKAPCCPAGFLAATTDPEMIERLWRDHPGELVGVPTGQATGFDALDLDLVKHHEAEGWWKANRSRFPETRTHTTRSGGLHLLFNHLPGLRCSAGRIAPGVDIRADGGYVVWWPAIGLPLVSQALAGPWPAWLVGTLLPPNPPRHTVLPPAVVPEGVSPSDRYAHAALHHATSRVANAPNGTRNATLNRECFAIARFVATGTLGAQEVADTLACAAVAAGLDRREIEATVASALGASLESGAS